MFRAFVFGALVLLVLAACGATQAEPQAGAASDVPTVTMYKPPT